MELVYEWNQYGGVRSVRFEGLDGRESVTSVKQALEVLQVENPAVVFTKAVKAGLYDSVPEEEYQRMLHAVERTSRLWRYPEDKPVDKTTRPSMNVLMLLANAIEVISRQNEELDLPF